MKKLTKFEKFAPVEAIGKAKEMYSEFKSASVMAGSYITESLTGFATGAANTETLVPAGFRSMQGGLFTPISTPFAKETSLFRSVFNKGNSGRGGSENHGPPGDLGRGGKGVYDHSRLKNEPRPPRESSGDGDGGSGGEQRG